jgi:hypothetical protein
MYKYYLKQFSVLYIPVHHGLHEFSDLQIITGVFDQKKKQDLICLHYTIKHLLATIISISHQKSLLASLGIQGCELF